MKAELGHWGLDEGPFSPPSSCSVCCVELKVREGRKSKAQPDTASADSGTGSYKASLIQGKITTHLHVGQRRGWASTSSAL